MSEYVIIDEPKPSGISKFTVNPLWPLFSFMLGGAYFSWLCFVINSYAMGSPTKVKELITVVFGILGSLCLIIGYNHLLKSGYLVNLNPRYFGLCLITLQLSVTYFVYIWQSTAFEIYEYFDGEVMNGIPILVAAFFLGTPVHNFFINLALQVGA